MHLLRIYVLLMQASGLPFLGLSPQATVMAQLLGMFSVSVNKSEVPGMPTLMPSLANLTEFLNKTITTGVEKGKDAVDKAVNVTVDTGKDLADKGKNAAGSSLQSLNNLTAALDKAWFDALKSLDKIFNGTSTNAGKAKSNSTGDDDGDDDDIKGKSSTAATTPKSNTTNVGIKAGNATVTSNQTVAVNGTGTRISANQSVVAPMAANTTAVAAAAAAATTVKQAATTAAAAVAAAATTMVKVSAAPTAAADSVKSGQQVSSKCRENQHSCNQIIFCAVTALYLLNARNKY